MTKSRYIDVATSKYVPLNPDTTPESVPVNAYFEMIIKKSTLAGTGGREGKCGEKGAKKAPTLRITGLTGGSCPMFGNPKEAEDFVNLLLLDSGSWTKSYAQVSDALELIYIGGAKTLPEDFVLKAWCNALNSTAAYQGKAVLHVESREFSQQFDDACDDDYEMTLEQVYVPRILSFAPRGLEPTVPEGGEYLAETGQEVLLCWEIRGDSLRAPVLVRNNGIPETVSPDTPVKRTIHSACTFTLRVESNSMPGVWNQRTIVFGISSGPGIAYFQAEKEFCLPGQAVQLTFGTIAAVNSTITAAGSAEAQMDVPAGADCVMAYPKLRDEHKRRVTYVLTASGYKGQSPASASAMTEIFVSRWKKQTAGQLPAFGEYDKAAEVFLYGREYYCFVGQKLWNSRDGAAWTMLSGPALPKGAEECQISAGICGAELYVLCGALEGELLYARYGLGGSGAQKWSACRLSGIPEACAGGAFCLIREGRMYCFTAREDMCQGWNYYGPPFENWGQAASLQAPAAIAGVSAVWLPEKLYLAVACADGYVYVYNMKEDLTGAVRVPKKIRVNTAWVRLVQADGGVLLLSEEGVYDVERDCRKDMMFSQSPRMLGVMKGMLAGVGQDRSLWGLEY